MKNEILTSENLVEIHENLNDFANHYQKLGVGKSIDIVKGQWDQLKKDRGVNHTLTTCDKGIDAAYTVILKELCSTFSRIP